MKKENTSMRLKMMMEERNLRQIDILNMAMPYCEKYKVKMNKSDISQYVSGKVEPNQDKLAVLGMALNVNEAWLMGYDVPRDRISSFKQPVKLSAGAKDLLSTYARCSPDGKQKIVTYSRKVLDLEKEEKAVDHLMPIAAHNDDMSPEQIALMMQDLEDL
ncbi:transcriptional regulator [Aminipila butyrica]|uniref:Transcriptional regulator n=1 Tax=Aminipila butyrica TaxID=433296 RepID=A0A858BV30_9FIRM|nr:transcriptional regulator [Aminipila butyrica]QIB68634.1 transcriptional regulator [Aminipila butyrica]